MMFKTCKDHARSIWGTGAAIILCPHRTPLLTGLCSLSHVENLRCSGLALLTTY